MSDTNGVPKKQWRDPTAAHLALLEPEKVEQRKVIARRMLAEGAMTDAIRAATKAETGTAIGGGTLLRIRNELARERKREERRLAREAKAPRKPRKAKAVEAPPEAPEARLPATSEIVGSLIAAGVPFSFDGKAISLKGRR